jgi:hypothetical protein
LKVFFFVMPVGQDGILRADCQSAQARETEKNES